MWDDGPLAVHILGRIDIGGASVNSVEYVWQLDDTPLDLTMYMI